MVKAYILMNVSSGRAAEVTKKMKEMEPVKQCHIVSGPYDIISLVEAKDFNSLGDFVVNTLQKMAGVERTVTCPIFTLNE